LHVEEDKVRSYFADLGKGRHAGIILSDNLNVGVADKKHGKVAARQWLVIHHNGSYLCGLFFCPHEINLL
jgi:hypothetical protein